MIKDGISIKNIASRYNIPYNTMLHHCKKLVKDINANINQQRRINEYKKRGYHVATKQELTEKLLMAQEIRKIKEDSL